MFNAQQFAMNLIQQQMKQNPNFANNANMKSMIDVIQSGDAARGEQIANNLLSSMGVPKDQAIQQAKQFFGIR